MFHKLTRNGSARKPKFTHLQSGHFWPFFPVNETPPWHVEYFDSSINYFKRDWMKG